MSAEIECRSCKNDLEQWNNGRQLWINYCPYCGKRLLKHQIGELHRRTTLEEVSDMIREHLLDVLSDEYGADVRADELNLTAWENENANGAVFCSNYKADLFVQRHLDWVDSVFVRMEEAGIAYPGMKECNDRFLASAFIEATGSYVFGRLGIDPDEGILSRKRKQEISRQIKDTEYDDDEW